jgi:2-(1,2-epoxy-1,2-dihydrophenyl)acetyl-CoA isomerase
MPDYQLAHAYETVNLHRDGGAARIELNRPETMNAWNEQFGHDLLDAVRTVAADEAVRVVELTGAGRGFSSGADLKSGRDVTDDGHPDVRTRLTTLYHPIILGLREMEKPVVATVHGAAVGIGCSLAMASDLVIAARSAYFLLAFVNIGLVPDGGSSVFLPAKIGFARAMQMSLLGERITADQALAWGMINFVVDDEELQARAGELVDKLASGPTRSYAGTKRQLNARAYAGIEQQLELEAEIPQGQAATADFMEGVLSFLQKRPPQFSGG